MSDDTRTVLVTRENADATDYVRALVLPDEDTAAEALAEAKSNAPWFTHSTHSLSDFEKASEKAVKAAEKEGK